MNSPRWKLPSWYILWTAGIRDGNIRCNWVVEHPPNFLKFLDSEWYANLSTLLFPIVQYFNNTSETDLSGLLSCFDACSLVCERYIYITEQTISALGLSFKVIEMGNNQHTVGDLYKIVKVTADTSMHLSLIHRHGVCSLLIVCLASSVGEVVSCFDVCGAISAQT